MISSFVMVAATTWPVILLILRLAASASIFLKLYLSQQIFWNFQLEIKANTESLLNGSDSKRVGLREIVLAQLDA